MSFCLCNSVFTVIELDIIWLYIYLQSHLKVCHPLLLSVSSCFCRWIGLNPPSPLFKLHLYLILLDNGAPLDKELEPNIHYIPPYPLEDDNNWSQATRRYINKYVNFYVMLMVESVSTNHCSVPVVHYTMHWIPIDLMLMINDDQSIATSIGGGEKDPILDKKRK